jgi:hypothetical protein
VIVHVLKLAFKDGTSEDDMAASLAAFERMTKLESVIFGVAGQYISAEKDHLTHAMCFAIEDLESLEHEYMKDPIHRESDFIVHPHVEKLEVFDLSDDSNPELGALIRGVHERRYENDAELAALIRNIPDVQAPATTDSVEGS